MLGLFRNRNSKSKQQKNPQDQIDPQLTEQIHTMPERFYLKPSKKRSGFNWMIVLGVFVILILAGVAIYLSLNLKNQANQPSEPVSPEPTQTTEPADNQGVEPLPSDNFGPATTTDLGLGVTSTTTTTSSDSLPAIEPIIEAQELAVDSDGDLLTLAEEQLYLTNSAINDTDFDNFEDGHEIINGYDPTIAGVSLEQSGLFKRYNHQAYSVLHPSRWEVREQGIDQTEVLFIADSGEFVEILSLENLNNLSLETWFVQQFPEFSQAASNKIKIKNVEAILHPNGLTYYVAEPQDPSHIYIVTYNLGGLIELRYRTTFRAIANSFELFH